MKNITLIIASILIVASSAHAGGPWTQQKGKGYFKLSEWWTVFDEHYTDSGLKDPNVTTGIFNTFFYAEYGLTNRLTAVLNAPILSRNYMNNLRSATTDEILVAGEAINSLGDIDFGIKYGITKPGSKIPIAATIMLGFPTGETAGGERQNLQTGDGEFNQLIQIDAGNGFAIGNLSAYVSAYAGVNNRTNDYSEEFRYGAEFGLGLLNSKLWVNTKLNVVESFKNGATAASATSTSIFANNTEFASIGFEANYYVSKSFGISAGVAGAFRGEIIAAAPSYSVGFFYDMK